MDTDTDTDPSRERPQPGRDPRVAALWCGVCGRSHPCTREQVSEYLRSGWPECCGKTMGVGRASPHPEALHPVW